MLQEIKLSQFGGINTEVDSNNAGVGICRQARNFILRPIGGIGVPPAWSYFSPNGVRLDLGFINTADYLFSAGVRLIVQSPNGTWWDVTPKPGDGQPINVTVATPASYLSANLVIPASKVFAFATADSGINWRMGASDSFLSWWVERLGTLPYSVTNYSADRAFSYPYGPVFTDPVSGQLWKLGADDEIGVIAETI